jgi:hypothetical protein
MTIDEKANASANPSSFAIFCFSFGFPLLTHPNGCSQIFVSRLHFLPFLPIVVIGFIVGQWYRWRQICCHEPEQSEVD